MSTWECVSCGAAGQEKPYCEACGAAQAMDGVDTALSLVIGRVCTSCDAYNDPGEAACASCGAPLVDEGQETAASIADGAAPSGSAAATPQTLADVAPPGGTSAVAPSSRSSPSAPPPSPPSPPSPPPQWMQAPTGQPLATAFAVPKVDLSEMKRSAQGMAAPASTPAPFAAPPPVGTVSESPPAAPVTLCGKCGLALEPGDKFCRSCGTRIGEAAPPTATRMQGLPSPMLGAGTGATSLMPAFRSVGLAGVGPGAPTPPSMTMVFGAVTAERSAKLVLVRGQSAFGTQWRLQGGETSIGRSVGAILFPDDGAIASEHARLRFSGGELLLEPVPSTNGVFVRIKEPTRLVPGDEVVLGAQRLVVLADMERRPAGVAEEVGTRLLGSLVKPQPPIALARVGAAAEAHEVYFRCQRVLTLGRSHCDLNFPRDSFVSERHAQLSRSDDGTLLLEDLRSRNGTYHRVHEPTRLVHGDLILLSDKVLRVELPQR